MRKSVGREKVDVRELFSALAQAHWEKRAEVTAYQVPINAITRVLHRSKNRIPTGARKEDRMSRYARREIQRSLRE